MLLLFYYGLKYIYNFSAVSMSCIIPTRPSKTAVSVYILLFHQFIDFNSCALNSNLAKLILFKIFTKEVTLTDDKAQIVDIPINSIAGYTAYCLNFCAFNGHVVSTCLSISAISESVRGTVRSDTSVTCSVRAAIIYIKQL